MREDDGDSFVMIGLKIHTLIQCMYFLHFLGEGLVKFDKFHLI